MLREEGNMETNEKDNLQKRLFELSADIESLKKQQTKNYEELNQILSLLGVGTYHQDPVTKIVYKVVVPSGTFVEYKTIGYERTAFSGEKRGSLSKKEAREAGFEVNGE
jgi:hypothetical protein